MISALAILLIVLFSATAVSAAVIGEGVKLRKLTNDGRSYLENGAGCSPEGNRVAYYRTITDKTRELCVLHPESGKTQTISDVGQPFGAVWSRDGSKLAFIFSNSTQSTSDTRLLIWDAASGKTTRTALRDKRSEFQVTWQMTTPNWSPDGSRLLVALRREDSTGRILIVPTDGSRCTEVAPNHPSNLFAESQFLPPNEWSADGSRFVFASWQPGEIGQVWSADAKGEDLRALTDEMPNIWSVAQSWDGRRIAFTTSEGRLEEERKSGDRDIWVMNADGSDPHPLTHGSAPALEDRIYWRFFHWTRDDRYLIATFHQRDETGEERYDGFDLIDANTGEIIHAYVFEWGISEQFISDAYSWADSWDGKRIAFKGYKYTIRGPRGGEQHYENARAILKVFSIHDREMTDLLTYSVEDDRENLSYAPGWTSDGRHLVITKTRTISAAEGKYESDLFLVSVPGTEEVVTAPADTPKTAEPTPAAPAAVAAAKDLVELSVLHRRAAEAAELLPAGHNGTFTIDENRNALLVAEDAPNLEALKKCLAAVDRNVPHIMVDVLVTELSKEANKELGLDWEFARSRFGGMLPFGPESTPGYMLWQGVGQLDEKFIGTLSMLAQKGEATVRANPRVLATSGKEASITIRRTDFFLYTSGVDWEGRPVRSRSDISADTILKITPILLGDGRISVQVDATVDSFTFVGRDDLPDTTRRQAVTDVICSEGESIIIGGLTQQERATTLHKTPILGDLPLLGPLFRHTRDQSRESTLVMFITPRLSAPQR